MSVGNKKNEKAQLKLASFVRVENMSLVVDGRPARVYESVPFLNRSAVILRKRYTGVSLLGDMAHR